MMAKSNTTFSQTNNNQSKCSAWLKDRNRCCERVISMADRGQRDSLFALLTNGGVDVDVEKLAQEFVDLHFCNNWHRRGGKHAFIRNPDDSWQVFQKILEEDYPAEQDIDAPIPNRHQAGNGRSFTESTTSNLNQASGRSRAIHLQMNPEIQENPISPMTDLPYPEAEVQRIPISPVRSWADPPHSIQTVPHSNERTNPSPGASPPTVTTPVREVLRRSARIRAQQRFSPEVSRASELGPSSVTAASSVPIPAREFLPNAQGTSQATRTSIPAAPITPPTSRNSLRRSVRIQERTSVTESNPRLQESVTLEHHSRTMENKDHYGQRNRPTAPRSSQTLRHILTPRQSTLASRSTNDAQPAQLPQPSAQLSANQNTASREVAVDEECTVCDNMFGHDDRVHKCDKCLHIVHQSCFANWLCASKSSQTCIFCRDPLSEKEVLEVFDSIGGAEGREYRGRYRLMKLRRN